MQIFRGKRYFLRVKKLGQFKNGSRTKAGDWKRIMTDVKFGISLIRYHSFRQLNAGVSKHVKFKDWVFLRFNFLI